jgi:hypothetical protein
VDGDNEGLGYVSQLRSLDPPPSAIIRWHDGAMIEDICGWMLLGTASDIHVAIGDVLCTQFGSVVAVVDYLKQHKVDLVAYEAVAYAIANNSDCRARASDLFMSLAAAAQGIGTVRFSLHDGVWVFQP